MRLHAFFGKFVLVGLAALVTLAPLAAAHAGDVTVLYAFKGGKDGAYPNHFSNDPGLIEDAAGNLYGTTDQGGFGKVGGNGTVFKLAPDGKKTTIFDFHGHRHGNDPGAA